MLMACGILSQFSGMTRKEAVSAVTDKAKVILSSFQLISKNNV